MLSPFCVQFKQAKNNKHKADLHYHKKHTFKKSFFFSFCGFHSCLGNEREGPHPSQPEDILLLLKCHVKVVVISFCGNNSAGPQSSHTGVSVNKGLSDFTWHRCNIHARGEKQQSVKLQKKVSTAVRPDQVACSP